MLFGVNKLVYTCYWDSFWENYFEYKPNEELTGDLSDWFAMESYLLFWSS